MASSTDSCILETSSYNSDQSAAVLDHHYHSTSWFQRASIRKTTNNNVLSRIDLQKISVADHNICKQLQDNQQQQDQQQQETMITQHNNTNQRITPFMIPVDEVIEKNERKVSTIISSIKKKPTTIIYGGDYDDDDEHDADLFTTEELVAPSTLSLHFKKEYLEYEDPDISMQSRIDAAQKRKQNGIVDLFDGLYTERECYFTIFAGIVLSFNCGLVDGACTSGMLNASSDSLTVTGLTLMVSESAVHLADGDYGIVRLFSSNILSFMLGAFLAGLLSPNATPYRIEPTYGPTFLIGGIVLLISSLLAAFCDDHRYFFFFASASIGIQNGISSMYTSNLIRPTAVTSSVTDVFVFLGQMAKGKYENFWNFALVTSILGSFWMGAFVSFFATRQFQSYFLLFSAALMLCIGAVLVAFLVIELQISVKAALLGTWQWKRALDTFHNSIRHDIDFMMQQENNHHHGHLKADHHDGTEPIGFALSEKADIFMAIFDRIDTDRSGTIDREELSLALKEAGMKISRREVKAMMDHADTDKDGLISRQEWMNIAMSYQPASNMVVQQGSSAKAA